MIRLIVKDFQAIDDADVEISGLTVVLGASNSGKSALVRALQSAITNQPPAGYVRRGAKFAHVSLEFGDGDSIVWEKGENHSLYRVDGQTYEKTGRIAPDAVRAKGFRPLVVGEASHDVQVAPQHSPLLLMGKGSGTVLSSVVSSLSGLDPVMRAVRLVATDRQEASRQAAAAREEIESLDAQLSPLSDIDDVMPFVEDSRRILTGFDALLRVLDWLEDQIVLLAQARREIERGSAAGVGLPDPAGIEEHLREIRWMDGRLEALPGVRREVGFSAARDVALRDPEDASILSGEVSVLDAWIASLRSLEGVARLGVELGKVRRSPDLGEIDLHSVTCKEIAWICRTFEALDAARRAADGSAAGSVTLVPPEVEDDLEEIQMLHRWATELDAQGKSAWAAEASASTLTKEVVAALEEIGALVALFPTCPFCGTEASEGHACG